MSPLLKNRRKGFLLFEVLLGVSIMAVVSVFVIRSFSVSLRAAEISRKYTQAVFLLEELMWDLERKSIRDKKVLIEEPQGAFPLLGKGTEWREKFSWQIGLKELTDSLREIGKKIASDGFIDEQIVNRIPQTYKFPLIKAFLAKIMFKVMKGHPYWDRQLKANNAFDHRYDRPYL